MKKIWSKAGAVIFSTVLLMACGEKVTDNSTDAERIGNGSEHEAVTDSIVEVEEDEEVPAQSALSDNTAKSRELMALPSSEEEAQEIADLYEIELVHFENGVATYHTDEDPAAVIQRGIDNNWPPIAVNNINTRID